jgi:hypothetical protein
MQPLAPMKTDTGMLALYTLHNFSKETLINCLPPDATMDLVCGTGKKRSNTGSISSIFAEGTRQIGGAYDGRTINHRFPNALMYEIILR